MDLDAAFGLQKLTLLDFPGRMAATVFVPQCNFRCPFCHNAFLVAPDADLRKSLWSMPALFDFLSKRAGVIEGVCITGGEPLLYSGIAELISGIKACDLAVKLDTNGSFPEKLKSLVKKGLIDYVAMDIKNSFEKYPTTSGKDDIDISKINESIDFLMSSDIDYEFRTTVVRELHTTQDIVAICKRISGAKKYFLQNFVDSGDILENGLNPMPEDILDKMLLECMKFTQNIFIRGKA